MKNTITWKCVPFSELSLNELYDILALRTAVFVVEQNCVYQELDGKDSDSHHLLGYDYLGQLSAYLRIVAAGISYDELSLGRIVTATACRGKGIGNELMQQAMEFIEKEYGNAPVRISAQAHLEKFYSGHGFKKASKPYMEDGIPHIEMLYAPC